MIDAILKRKMDVTEDVLTSCVVGILEKMPPDHDLLAWLAKARPHGPAMHEALRFGDAAHAKVFYWPRTTSGNIPDVFVMVEDGPVTHAIVLEAKYDAPKSNRDSDDPEEFDQLARYWKALHAPDMPDVPEAFLKRAEKTVIYVTADSTPPVEDLDESVQSSNGAIRLAWLSWRDAWALAEPLRESGGMPSAWLLALLEHLGLTQFRGFGSAGEPAVADQLWYFDRGGFDAVAKIGVEHELLWRFA